MTHSTTGIDISTLKEKIFSEEEKKRLIIPEGYRYYEMTREFLTILPEEEKIFWVRTGYSSYFTSWGNGQGTVLLFGGSRDGSNVEFWGTPIKEGDGGEIIQGDTKCTEYMHNYGYYMKEITPQQLFDEAFAKSFQ